MTKYKEGDLISNRYLLEKYLGSGTYGEVWKAKDIATQGHYAIKFYVAMDERGRNELIQEFNTTSGLSHQNILTAKHYDIWDNRPYLVMDYCSNGGAEKLVGNISEEDLWRFIRDVAAGLDYLHNLSPNPIIHQDIKPDNVMINDNGNFVISDFGISIKMRSTMQFHQSDTMNNNSGALAYMGPERFSSDASPLKASDIWSLGATIYEMATGVLPFCGLGGSMQQNGAQLPALDKKWSPELNNLMQKCLDKSTWNRPKARDIYDIAQKHLTDNPPKSNWKWVVVIIGVILISGISIMMTHNTSLRNESYNEFPQYKIVCEKCEESLSKAQNTSDKLLYLQEAKSRWYQIKEMEKKYASVNSDYSRSSKFYNQLDSLLTIESQKWRDQALMVLEKFDEKEEQTAVKYYQTALQLKDEGNHIPKLDSLCRL